MNAVSIEPKANPLTKTGSTMTDWCGLIGAISLLIAACCLVAIPIRYFATNEKSLQEARDAHNFEMQRVLAGLSTSLAHVEGRAKYPQSVEELRRERMGTAFGGFLGFGFMGAVLFGIAVIGYTRSDRERNERQSTYRN